MVAISEVPTLSMEVMQERAGAPSTCTVQAPHNAMPHPNFVPVIPNTSRNTQRSGVSPSTSTSCLAPLTCKGHNVLSSAIDSFGVIAGAAVHMRTQRAAFKVRTAVRRSFLIWANASDGRLEPVSVRGAGFPLGKGSAKPETASGFLATNAYFARQD
jgi:hypothetical protein